MLDFAEIAKGHADIMRTGLKHGEQIALGKACAIINQLRDSHPVLPESYRRALTDVEAGILALMKTKDEDWGGVA